MNFTQTLLDNLELEAYLQVIEDNKDIIKDYDKKLEFLSDFHTQPKDYSFMLGLNFEFITLDFDEFYKAFLEATRFDIAEH